MSWIKKQLELTDAHFTYLLLSAFLIIFSLFSHLIRNTLHLSEPPLATLIGIAFGPKGAGLLDPIDWGWQDNTTQEATRVIVGIQVFAVGIELPRGYLGRHWRSVAVLLGPVMAFSWLITALFIYLVLQIKFTVALIISACLAPTDPVLSASVLNSRFSTRVPSRVRHMLSCETGCNDGTSFPFLYAGLNALIATSVGGAAKEWVLETILWQCLFGIVLGLIIGIIANRSLRFSERNGYIDASSFFAFYLLLALFSIGVASILGADDFLVAFGAGSTFAWDGWFAHKTKEAHLPNIADLLLNSSMFVYFGAIIPWSLYTPSHYTPHITPGRLVGLLILILLFRRIPILLALKRLIPDLHTYTEAFFAGHFGPMGLGALFLVIEARAQLETGTSQPYPHPPPFEPSISNPSLNQALKHREAIETVWPVTTFIILGSVMVHGLSVVAISTGSHFARGKGQRASIIGGETDGLTGMVHDEDESIGSVASDESGNENPRESLI